MKIIALVLGAATVPGFAPFGVFPLCVLTLAGLLLLWNRCGNSREAATIGFAFGLGLFLAGVSWVYVSLHDFGAMVWPLAAGVTLLFCMYLACFPALVGALLSRCPASLGMRSVFLFPALWAFSEWFRGWFLSGFPWLAIGYAQVPASPLAGFAPVLGVFGVSLVTALTAGAAAWLAEEKILSRLKSNDGSAGSFPWAAAAILIGMPILGAGLQRVEWTRPLPGDPITVALVQGNITQDLKWRPEQAAATLDTYANLVRASQATLILLPESALPMFDVDVPKPYMDALAAHARRHRGDILLGIPELDSDRRYYNSVISLGTTENPPYRKVHLVPFGDYFPLRPVLGWVMKLMDIPMSGFSPGEKSQKPMQVAGQKIAANICYEDAFGEEIIRQLPEASLLANFTNDAWWGKSIASRQHLQIAQMRALETGRPMLRATNTGVSAIIGPDGDIVAAAPEFVTTTLNGTVRGYQGATPYVRVGNFGFCAIAALMLAAALWRRRSPRSA
ncbi:MAG: apolipoprotein N-acyltransferase [Burkholderiales bacterium]